MALYLAIEKAASIEGSQRALAKRLGIRENYLSDMKHGLKPCTVANRVKIAQIAGVDPKRAAVEGLIDQLDDSDEIQKGAKTMLQSMLAAFPERTDESQYLGPPPPPQAVKGNHAIPGNARYFFARCVRPRSDAQRSTRHRHAGRWQTW